MDEASGARVCGSTWTDGVLAAPTTPATLPQATNVTIEVYLDGDWHNRRDNNDGEIIDQALAIQELTGQLVVLTTCD